MTITTTLEQSRQLKEPYGRYFVMEDGEVISTYWKKPRFIGQFLVNGYRAVSLRGKTFKVHRIIAEVFVQNPHDYPCVNHKDGNKDNNHFSNLEWCNHSQNMRHAYENDLKEPSRGEGNGTSKLTDEAVQKIRNSPLTGKELAPIYGVSETVISQVKRRQRWAHV